MMSKVLKLNLNVLVLVSGLLILADVAYAKLNVSFEINEELAIAQLLNRGAEEGESASYIESLRSAARSGKFSTQMAQLESLSAMQITPSDLYEFSELLDSLKGSTHWKRAIQDVELHRDRIRSRWRSDLPGTKKWMKRVTGLSLRGDFTVLVLSPKQSQAWYYFDYSNVMAYGSPQYFSGHSTVFIWHEILHGLVHNSADPIPHAMIELVADNALKYCLSSFYGDLEDCISSSRPFGYSEGWTDATSQSHRSSHYSDWLQFLGNRLSTGKTLNDLITEIDR